MWKTIGRLLAALLAGLVCPAHAQGYPARPVVFVFPFAPGAGIDGVVRPYTQRLSVSLGTSVAVDYKPGANSIIGTDYVARSAADGYTFLFSSPSIVNNQFLYSKLPYDLVKDLTPVAGFIRTGFAVAVRPSLPVGNTKELIDLARARPGQLTYATAGLASGFHLAMEMLQSAAGITLTHVPYKGTAPAILDVSAGRVDMIILSGGSLAEFARAGKVKPVAVTTLRRSAAFPDVQTVAESGGLPAFEALGWWVIHAPAGVPRSIVERINADTRQILSDPPFRSKFVDPRGEEPMLMTVPELEAFQQAELTKWGRTIRDAKLKLD